MMLSKGKDVISVTLEATLILHMYMYVACLFLTQEEAHKEL